MSSNALRQRILSNHSSIFASSSRLKDHRRNEHTDSEQTSVKVKVSARSAMRAPRTPKRTTWNTRRCLTESTTSTKSQSSSWAPSFSFSTASLLMRTHAFSQVGLFVYGLSIIVSARAPNRLQMSAYLCSLHSITRAHLPHQ